MEKMAVVQQRRNRSFTTESELLGNLYLQLLLDKTPLREAINRVMAEFQSCPASSAPYVLELVAKVKPINQSINWRQMPFIENQLIECWSFYFVIFGSVKPRHENWNCDFNFSFFNLFLGFFQNDSVFIIKLLKVVGSAFACKMFPLIFSVPISVLRFFSSRFWERFKLTSCSIFELFEIDFALFQSNFSK